MFIKSGSMLFSNNHPFTNETRNGIAQWSTWRGGTGGNQEAAKSTMVLWHLQKEGHKVSYWFVYLFACFQQNVFLRFLRFPLVEGSMYYMQGYIHHQEKNEDEEGGLSFAKKPMRLRICL